MEILLFLLSWFGVGLLAVLIMCVYDMRGKKYNPNYFNGHMRTLILLILSGYISAVIVLFLYLEESKTLTKLMYKIANIGIEKED